MEIFNNNELKKIGKKLLKNKQTIAVGESVTSGILQFAFSSIPDASKFYQGGITTYNIGQKYSHLKVEPIHALSVNCVSQKVAIEMAINVSKLFKSDWGIGITGYATPETESNNKVFSFYAIVFNDIIQVKGKIPSSLMAPALLQIKYANTVLGKLEKLL